MARRLYPSHTVKALRAALFIGGIAVLAYLVARVGAEPLMSALARLAWWQFVLICLPYGLIMAVDTLGWRYAFVYDRVPFLRLVAARIAGEAVNVMTAVVPMSHASGVIHRSNPFTNT